MIIRLFQKIRPVIRPFKRTLILGIESSCDDTGAAILSLDGRLLGECLSTQLSSRFGGIIPSLAMAFHAVALPKVVDETFSMANVRREDIDAIAITTKPGLSGSLSIGSQYARYLSRKFNKPLIPIHHMEAHALTARMVDQVEFPFLVLLVSGGHCLLAMAQDINKFLLLGSSHDNSPGEALDKIARRLRLHTLLPEFRDTSGGKAIEIIGRDGDPEFFKFPVPLSDERSCRFSWSGFRTFALRLIERIEAEHEVPPDELIPHLAHFCASVELGMSRHLCRRLQRGFVFSDLNDLWSQHSKTLVVSGGVGCNKRIRNSLKTVCDAFDVRLVAPDAKYCTDNGLMIAWNGLEKFRRNLDLVRPEDVFGQKMDIEPRAPFGTDISDQVLQSNIKCTWVKLKGL